MFCYSFLRHYSRQVFQSTIFALSSGQGKCGVAVIRVSGPCAGNAIKHLTAAQELPQPRRATLQKLKHPHSGEVLDKGLVLWFPAPHSFTGEDSSEFQIHGGVAVINALLNALGLIPNLRLASPGEFTKRAFYNGKLDLTQAEGLSDLLSAETELQRKQAFLQTEGCLKNIYNDWKKVLVSALANLEAYIDFHETEVLDADLVTNTMTSVRQLSGDISKHLSNGIRGERLRNGVKTVLIGETNVGKSSLANILCNRPLSIVTPLHGTTRDVLEATLDVAGYPMILNDTAGLRSQTSDIIEQEGINRTIKACEEANLILLVVDCENYLLWYKESKTKNFLNFLTFYTQNLNIFHILFDKDLTFKKECIIIANKVDLVKENDLIHFQAFKSVISCTSMKGVDTLTGIIIDKLKLLCGEPTKEHPSMNQIRHREYLTLCLKHLESFLNDRQSFDNNVVFMAEKLRKALRQLDKLTGTFTTEQLLSVIFKEFCIGK
ncbi:hypothetical protein RI129_008998 [Pyrocoelia pectoralis]|uniref:tRNA modification GTPase GTPBP3, mitochondrial n=1 Tax=Pyrocoelia pectoralis TaxID=417401 RepID=A0AAN7ZLM1_9COLE